MSTRGSWHRNAFLYYFKLKKKDSVVIASFPAVLILCLYTILNF